MKSLRVLLAGAMLAVVGAAASADSLPSTSHTTTVSALVAEQATITTPATISFNVGDATATTNATSGDFGCSNIVLVDGNHIKMSLQANAAAFTAPGGTGATWDATDISWSTSTFGAGNTFSANTLSSTAYSAVVDSAINASSFTGGCTFSLAPKAVGRAGTHTLVMTWKVESL